ncbi:MAG: response regulator transcription factor [Pseudomonadota bacterium]
MEGKSFLILEDDVVFSQVLMRALSRRGITTHIAHSGEAALALTKKHSFDYVTVDLQLENDSGLQWIASLRASLPQTKMLVLTGYASIVTAVQAVKLGADNYLAKPANAEAILSALDADSDQIDALEWPEPMSVGRVEWEHIQRILAEHEGNISSTARALNMHRRTLQRKLFKRPSLK